MAPKKSVQTTKPLLFIPANKEIDRHILEEPEQMPNILFIKSNNICCETDTWLVKAIIDAFEL